MRVVTTDLHRERPARGRACGLRRDADRPRHRRDVRRWDGFGAGGNVADAATPQPAPLPRLTLGELRQRYPLRDRACSTSTASRSFTATRAAFRRCC